MSSDSLREWERVPLAKPLQDFDSVLYDMDKIDRTLQLVIVTNWLSGPVRFNIHDGIHPYENKDQWALFRRELAWITESEERVRPQAQFFLQDATKFIEQMEQRFDDKETAQFVILNMLVKKAATCEDLASWTALMLAYFVLGNTSHEQLKRLHCKVSQLHSEDLNVKNTIYYLELMIHEQILIAKGMTSVTDRLFAWKLKVWSQEHFVQGIKTVFLDLQNPILFDLILFDLIPLILDVVEKLKPHFELNAEGKYIVPYLDFETIRTKPWKELFLVAFVHLYRNGNLPIETTFMEEAFDACLNYYADRDQLSFLNLPALDAARLQFKRICDALDFWSASHYFGAKHLLFLANNT